MQNNIKHFSDLDVWKHGHKLVLDVYKTTKSFPREEVFGLVSQMRRAASSVTANIAEGCGRYYYKEKIKFYQQARGSIMELQNHLFLAADLVYINKDIFNDTSEQSLVVLREINALISSIRNKVSKVPNH